MNKYQEAMMDKRSVDTAPFCAICGVYVGDRIERHHIVPRSQGGGSGPTITVCGWGNLSGCHGRFHNHTLHMRYGQDGWEVLGTEKPTKFDKAVKMSGWWKIRRGHGL